MDINKDALPKEEHSLQQALEKIADDEASMIPQIDSDSAPVYTEVSETPENSKTPEAPPSELPPSPEPLTALAEPEIGDSISSWFFTFMCMNIPIAGWIYLFYLAFNKKRTDRKSFARAYLFYKLVFLLISLIILIVIIIVSMNLLDQLLAYMEML